MKILKVILFTCIVLIDIYAKEMNEKIDACNKGNIQECHFAGVALISGENGKNQEKKSLGLELIRKACKYGEQKACNTLGENYYEDKHYQAAKPFLEEACTQGKKEACWAIGRMYRDAQEIKQDDILAREYFEKSCVLGSKGGCMNVALIYRGGFGVKKNRTKEKFFYQKACELGSEQGCKRFKNMDNKDKGIEEPSILDKLKSLFN